MGGIALNKHGEVGVARNVDLMPHAYVKERMKDIQVGFAPKMTV